MDSIDAKPAVVADEHVEGTTYEDIPPVCGTSTTTSKTPRQIEDLEKALKKVQGQHQYLFRDG